MNKDEYTILVLLDEDKKWWYALYLLDASHGRLNPGTIYVRLGSLVEQGLIEVRKQTDEELLPQIPTVDRFRRRLYRINKSGIRSRRDHDFPSALPELA